MKFLATILRCLVCGVVCRGACGSSNTPTGARLHSETTERTQLNRSTSTSQLVLSASRTLTSGVGDSFVSYSHTGDDATVRALPDVLSEPVVDSGSNDSGSKDSGSQDSGSKDSGSKDSGSPDSGSTDSGSKDSGSKDSGSKDSGSNDSGSKANYANASLLRGKVSLTARPVTQTRAAGQPTTMDMRTGRWNRSSAVVINGPEDVLDMAETTGKVSSEFDSVRKGPASCS